ncbi:SEC-C metal-binding domain-containing protein [Aquibacillus salsiterrae]|uniref:SEC-C metal-binding domain-containing protein n=1 Tax=Aquibacillus salsiterrae TaxID=2950439 RepID=A0A9X4AGC7_9BACI|nr:SEC-C metal-binding domain-containing protein [Aquibacillus salsiterrae]MDC3417145.1 SEC-C metal-binding domain-containing protein [Aquibacillus salsiterrae]
MTVGRNDLCPCGSGKKYKKCCMSNVVSLNAVIGDELDKLQEELLEFADEHYFMEVAEVLEDEFDDVEVDEREQGELLSFLLTQWIIFNVEFDQNKTILDKFIENKAKSVRPSTLNRLKEWTRSTPVFSVVKEVADDSHLVVEDVITRKVRKIKLWRDHEPIGVDDAIFGYLLPYGEYYQYFYFGLDMPADESQQVVRMFTEMFEASPTTDAEEFMQVVYPEFIKLLVTGGEALPLPEYNWTNPLHETVANLFEKKCMELGDFSPAYIEIGKMYWYTFCQKEDPNFRKPQMYAAGLHYFVDMNTPWISEYSQKDLAEIYNTSAGSVSKVYRMLEDVLDDVFDEEQLSDVLSKFHQIDDDDDDFFDDEMGLNPFSLEKTMGDITKAISEKDFDSLEEVDEFLQLLIDQPDLISQDNSDAKRAQELIYDAYDKPALERVEIAKKALELDPNCVDAYNLLGDHEVNPTKALQLYKTGMEIGEKELGKQFLKDNKGMFWGLIETRPFMRAKFNYASLLREFDEKAAIKQFEELLELNENDNQGVRDILGRLYLEDNNIDDAKRMLQRFDENRAVNAYQDILIDYLLHGLSEKLEELLNDAKKVNPYVIDFLTKKEEVPDSIIGVYQPGDKNEAAMYASDFLHLWEDEKELIDWLKKKS